MSSGPAFRTCKHCGETKELSEFTKNSKLPSGRTGRCKVCLNRYHKEWRARNPESHLNAKRRWAEKNPNADREKHLKRKYGITAGQYDDLLAAQGGVCAICLQPERMIRRSKSGAESLAVDHDHSTGKVRGLLCTKCNTGLGLLGDDPEIIAVALAYVRGSA